jgi:hypothetical protein
LLTATSYCVRLKRRPHASASLLRKCWCGRLELRGRSTHLDPPISESLAGQRTRAHYLRLAQRRTTTDSANAPLFFHLRTRIDYEGNQPLDLTPSWGRPEAEAEARLTERCGSEQSMAPATLLSSSKAAGQHAQRDKIALLSRKPTMLTNLAVASLGCVRRQAHGISENAPSQTFQNLYITSCHGSSFRCRRRLCRSLAGHP